VPPVPVVPVLVALEPVLDVAPPESLAPQPSGAASESSDSDAQSLPPTDNLESFMV
jgi:hypothetical protein